ncbi:uncharacterized protein LOC116343618 [Contarinia nasturtii]|uniref:uncharacterized protein LOC116343618 n=1 Tax=Contarinia nasturtii TaxID=265458 RepID=UPI0012D3FBE5|nr:uncharacterized protein LOC116343618 [Contarinia nasturtii]XP_031627660.1 uncharacterized protein LOC116343618 [Contarinia nasturtii]XP_031627661.1 uncharacterized protein LOC116343618 [Contarinia nasturtii]
MFDVKNYKLKMFAILLCLMVIALCGVVTTQEALPYQYERPYQNAFNHDRRRYSAPFSGFNAASSLSGNRDLIRFPDDGMSPVNQVSSLTDENIFNERHKKDNKPNHDDESHHQLSNEVVPMNVTNDLNSYDDFFNLLDEESRGQIEVISPRFGVVVERSSGSRPIPAQCKPEMAVVPLRLSDGSDVKDPTIVVFPSCTRVKQCSGCCNNNLVSCQAIETNIIVYEVFKSQYQSGGKMKFLNKEIVEVEEHTKCKCDCRKKESDCKKNQRYNKSQCLCYCINIEDKNKCLAETEEKIWDPDTCKCQCRESKDCSSGTYFDENTCSCQGTPGHRHTQQVSDRRRLITKPVIFVPETPQTYYDSGT